MELKNSKTFTNLARAYVGESCARNRYDMLALLARKEGYTMLAEQIEKIAWNEFQHSRMLFSFIDSADPHVIENIEIRAGFPFKEKLKSLVGNLNLAAEDEAIEAEKIYPEFAKIAREEGFKDIAAFFDNLVQIETCHNKFFNIMYLQLKNGTIYKRETPIKWKCDSCGYESTSKTAWQTCPVCQAPQGWILLEYDDQSGN